MSCTWSNVAKSGRWSVTNSLAATDEPLVYAAYRRYRPQLLRLGVEI